MLVTIVTALLLGALVGGLARLVMPGDQNISVLATVLIGTVGSTLGSWLVRTLGYKNEDGIAWLAILAGVLTSIALISAYLAITLRRARLSGSSSTTEEV